MILLAYIREELAKNTSLRVSGSTRQVDLILLKSEARRSYSFCPWATNHKETKVWVEDVLLSVSETSEDGKLVPAFGLEASLFRIPSTGVTLLYISKADTTGLFARPSTAKTVTAAFVSWYLLNGGSDVRVHVFGRAAAQYLYPGSVENSNKRVLSDKRLCGWWKSVLTLAASLAKQDKGKQVSAWFALPDTEASEARRMIGSAQKDPDNSIQWSYGHPYKLLPPICSSAPDAVQLGDLIPAFPDDPKSRFLTSLTSSPMSSAGEPGDYEDAHLSSHGKTDNQLEHQRGVEKARLKAIGVDEYWERLAFRQECCSGAVVGFFVLVSKDESASSKAVEGLEKMEQAAIQDAGTEAAEAKDGPQKEAKSEVDAEATNSSKKDEIPCLSHSTYTKLWSIYHNCNYSLQPVAQPVIEKQASPTADPFAPIIPLGQTTEKAIARIANAHAAWLSQLKTALLGHPGHLDRAFQSVTLQEGTTAEKRKADELDKTEGAQKPQVMTLKPRKKAKPA